MGRSLGDTLNRAMNDEVDVDFSGAREGGGFGPIDTGEYQATVIECTSGTSQSGAPKVTFKFRINDGEENAGRVFFKHCPTKGEGAGILRDVLRSLGLSTDDMKRVKPSALVNKSCIINIRYQKGSDALQEISYTKALKGKTLSAATAKKVDGNQPSRSTTAAKKATGATKKSTGRSRL